MREAFLLTFHWGWLSSGTYAQLRHDQGTGYLAYLQTLPSEYFGKLAFSHAGWLFDLDMPPEVRQVPSQEIEDTLHVLPFSTSEVAAWRTMLAEGRLEPVTYYYIPLVAEQVTGEMLIRSIRYTREVFERELGVAPAALTTHDPFTLMNWGTAQQVQLAALTGHQVLLGGLEGMIVGMDGTRLPCIGASLQRYGLESMAMPMIEVLEQDGKGAFTFATEMHWHHRTNPFERALRQVAIRFKDNIVFKPCSINEWLGYAREWTEIPAEGLGSKGWNGGGPDQMQVCSLIRNCELILPGLEALESIRNDGGKLKEKIKTFWKRALFLNDNHIRWFIHDQKRIFIPAARALLADVQAATRDLLQTMSMEVCADESSLVVWNLLGWTRTAAAEVEIELPTGCKSFSLRCEEDERPVMQIKPLEWGPDGDLRRARVTWVVSNLPAWGYRVYTLVFSSGSRVESESHIPSPLVLENARLRATFAVNGELVMLEDKKSGRTQRGGNRLLNLIPETIDEEHWVEAARPLAEQGVDTSGCFCATAEVVLPEVAHYDLHLDEMDGCLMLIEVDVIDRTGNCMTPTQRFPVINLHWMGEPHRHTGARNIPLSELASGTRLRITLWFLSEGKSMIGEGAVRSQRHRVPIDKWLVKWQYHLMAVPAEASNAEIIEQGPVKQRLRFRGKLPQCSYETIATLAGAKDQPRIDFETRLTFAEPTQLGIPTPSMPPEVGSYLGSNNERPYIPGVAVTFPVPDQPELLVDSPYTLRDPMRSVHPEIIQRSWLADSTEPVENFWWGLSPFTALRSVLVRGWGGLIADGSPHFFLWRGLEKQEKTLLGFSMGASLIHPRTVSKRVSRDSEWFEFGRGAGYADFQDGSDTYEFNHPDGTYIYRYSLSLETDPLTLMKSARETSVPPWVMMVEAGSDVEKRSPSEQSWLCVDSHNIFLTGCEWLGAEGELDVVRVRLVEMAGKDTSCTLTSYRPVEQVGVGELPVETKLVDANRLQVKMPAHGVREILLYLKKKASE